MAQVLDAGAVEVRHVAAVVDDALGVGLVEPDPHRVREAERRLAVGDTHALMTASTSSRRRSISASV